MSVKEGVVFESLVERASVPLGAAEVAVEEFGRTVTYLQIWAKDSGGRRDGRGGEGEYQYRDDRLDQA